MEYAAELQVQLSRLAGIVPYLFPRRAQYLGRASGKYSNAAGSRLDLLAILGPRELRRFR